MGFESAPGGLHPLGFKLGSEIFKGSHPMYKEIAEGKVSYVKRIQKLPDKAPAGAVGKDDELGFRKQYPDLPSPLMQNDPRIRYSYEGFKARVQLLEQKFRREGKNAKILFPPIGYTGSVMRAVACDESEMAGGQEIYFLNMQTLETAMMHTGCLTFTGPWVWRGFAEETGLSSPPESPMEAMMHSMLRNQRFSEVKSAAGEIFLGHPDLVQQTSEQPESDAEPVY